MKTLEDSLAVERAEKEELKKLNQKNSKNNEGVHSRPETVDGQVGLNSDLAFEEGPNVNIGYRFSEIGGLIGRLETVFDDAKDLIGTRYTASTTIIKCMFYFFSNSKFFFRAKFCT